MPIGRQECWLGPARPPAEQWCRRRRTAQTRGARSLAHALGAGAAPPARGSRCLPAIAGKWPCAGARVHLARRF
eukprot:scaffold7709_cov101-Isochrysis_galbana.AAC.2